MQYCGPRGIPHSQFLSWDPDDQDKALAWMLHEGEKCPGCGTFPSEWLDDEGYPVDPEPYDPKSLLCVGCKTLAEKQEEIPEDQQRWHHVFLRRRARS